MSRSVTRNAAVTNISATLPAILRDLTFVTDKVASGLAQ